ncbi:hypothetical protein J2W91_000220 [Paenibacillus amylolyticus]|uniref:Uncharacterized protein n=1 Tax=Paenibacillus amylolyticus TaxID=1451 RepID=A0AAP5GX21_PAEAM|nr:MULTISPECIES: hypothetical protein [Paenibacillus]MDR6721772.1 hypothetical protein [Paenibacillus amylolyticus]
MILFASLLGLCGCTTSVNDERVVAKSDHWIVTIDLVYKKGEYEEVPSIQYIGEDLVDEKVEINILHPNNSSTSNTLHVSIKPNEVIQLPTRSSVEDWRDIESVIVTWGVEEEILIFE